VRMRYLIPVAGVLSVVASTAARAEGGAGHSDPVAAVALAITIVLVAAKLGGEAATRLGQPSVLGELLAGVILGNLTLVNYSGMEWLKVDPAVDMLARLGVLILLFEVGLESTVRQMLQVGRTSLVVATLGVVAPFALGWMVGGWLLPAEGPQVHAFLGATLCATSVGITARILTDLGRSQSVEAHIILGAAVIDDVLGLVILAVVTGMIGAGHAGGGMSMGAIGIILGKATLFLVGSLVVGVLFSRKLFSLASRLRARGVLLALGLAFCFFFSWLANAIGLAPIVGAFAAGLVLEEVHYRDFVARGEFQLEKLVRPIGQFLVPVFFVVMGMRTDLRAFLEPGVPALAAALTVAAIAGKQLCSLGVFGRGIDRLSIGIGMVPRGEVGLIFASIGLSLSAGGHPVLSPATYSAIVAMVAVTTMLTPSALKWSLTRSKSGSRGSDTTQAAAT